MKAPPAPSDLTRADATPAGDRPIRVLQVVLSLRWGGLERVVVDLLNHLPPSIQSSLCCLETAGPLQSHLRLPVPVVALNKPPGLQWSLCWRIACLVRSQVIDLVHTHNAAAHFYGAIGAKLAGARVLHTEHGKNLTGASAACRLNRLVRSWTDLTTAVSTQVAREALEQEKVPAHRLKVVPNGIRIEDFQMNQPPCTLLDELGLERQTRLVGTVGRLVAEKDHASLIRAFDRIREQVPEAHLVLLGDGPLRGQLEELTRACGLSGRVHFLGFRSDVARWLAALDVFVLSSRTEGLPLALLEAMAARRPIVATAVGGNAEVLVNGETGLLVPVGEPGTLATAILTLLHDPSRARQLGVAAGEVARRRFSVEAMVHEYEQLYRLLVGNG